MATVAFVVAVSAVAVAWGAFLAWLRVRADREARLQILRAAMRLDRERQGW